MSVSDSAIGKLALIDTGTESGSWGTITNNNISRLEDMVDGYVSVAFASDANDSLTTTSASSGTGPAVDEAKHKVVELTGTLTASREMAIPALQKVYIVKNSTTGGYAITFGVNGQTTVSIANGDTELVYCDGTNTYKMSYTNSGQPTSDDGQALGASGTAWSDLFLASGAVINWNAGDVTATHSANTLAFAGASSGYTYDAVVKASSDDGAALGASGTGWSDLFLASGAVINWNAGDVTLTHSANTLAFAGASSGYTFDAAPLPASDDGAALGASGTAFSDLFLASGAVINFNAGNATITHSADLLTFNTTIQTGNIELGNASDTTLARVSAGVVSIEGNNIVTAGTAVAASDGGTIGQQTIYVPSGAMDPTSTAGAASSTTEELATNDVQMRYIAFDDSTQEHACFDIQMPKGWDEGTLVCQFLWYTAATSGDCIWAIQSVACADGDALDVAYGTAVTATDTAGTASTCRITSETGAMTVAGSPGAEELVHFKVYRDADAAGDTMSGDAKLIGVKIHYTIDAGNDS